MRFIRAFFRFWYDFVVGDDGWIAVGVALVLGLGAAVVAADLLSDAVLTPVMAVAIVSIVMARVVAGARASRS
jgi:hypothetical protein